MISKITYHSTVPSHPKICVLTGHSESQCPLALLTIYDVLAEYVLRWKHDMVILRGDMDGTSYFPILRLEKAVDMCAFESYDWIYIVGADLMITNLTIPISSFIDDAYDVIIPTDCNGWQADSFLLKCSRKGIDFINEVIKRFPQFQHSMFKEQDGMTAISEDYPGVCKVLPQRTMNSYNYDLYPSRAGRDGIDVLGKDGQWQPGDFLIHWAGLPQSVRVEEARKMIDRVQR